MAAMGGRPVLLQRFPNGAGGSSFFQKRVPEARPDWLETTDRQHPQRHHVAGPGRPPTWPTCCGRSTYGCLGFHVWPSQAADPEHADELRIDLDPSPGVDFPMLREAAREVQALSRRARGGRPCPRPPATGASTSTSGCNPGGRRTRCGRRRWRWPGSSSGAGPTWSPPPGGRRSGARRVFVDFNQNAPHKTIFGAWSVRARPGAQVSTPFRWDELDGGPSRRPHHRHRPRIGWRRRGTRGRAMTADPAVAGADARPPRAGPGRGPARRPVAARLPQDAGRAAPGGSQPGPQGPRGRGMIGRRTAAVAGRGGSGAGAAPQRLWRRRLPHRR